MELVELVEVVEVERMEERSDGIVFNVDPNKDSGVLMSSLSSSVMYLQSNIQCPDRLNKMLKIRGVKKGIKSRHSKIDHPDKSKLWMEDV